MYFSKRALLYVKRKWGKTITVGIILFVVSTLVLTGLLIKSASQKTFEVARDKLGSSVVYTSDLSSVMQQARDSGGMTRGSGFSFSLPSDYKTITTKEIEAIASNSKYVKNYTISAELSGKAVDFTYYDPSGSSSDTSTTESSKDNQQRFQSSANINIIGADIKAKEKNFNSDSSTIVDGRYFTDDEVNKASDVVIIEKTIADLNNIKVGDNLTIERVDRKMPENLAGSDTSSTNAVNITYNVVGIYKTKNPTDVGSSSFRGTSSLTENTMYAPYTTVLSASLAGLTGDDLKTAQSKIDTNGYEVQSVTFNLKNPADIDAFMTEVKAMKSIDTKYRSLNANDAAYEQMVGPIQNVASTSTVLVIVVVIAGAFIIGLLSMLSIKDRKYELGVLLSLGESKFKIVMQLISETLIIAVISFGLATIVSNFTSQVTTNFLLNQEVTAAKENQSNDNSQRGGFRGGFMMNRPNEQQLKNVDIKTIDTLTVSLNSFDILKMFGIGIIIIIMGNVLQAMFVLRCNPKEILLER